MKIVLISGLSGSGKSVALKQLEDLGYYCVDNLPLEMLPSLVSLHIERADETKLGVSVDIRSGINIQEAQEQIQYLRNEGHQVEVLFIEAEEGVLVRRFSETRRGHPLSGQNLTLLESLQKEREWLFPLRDIAYCIDTSKMNAQQLRYAVQQWLNIERVGLLVILESLVSNTASPTMPTLCLICAACPIRITIRNYAPLPAWISLFKIIWASSRWLKKWLMTSTILLAAGCRACNKRAAVM